MNPKETPEHNAQELTDNLIWACHQKEIVKSLEFEIKRCHPTDQQAIFGKLIVPLLYAFAKSTYNDARNQWTKRVCNAIISIREVRDAYLYGGGPRI